jgi:hypothetical protein
MRQQGAPAFTIEPVRCDQIVHGRELETDTQRFGYGVCQQEEATKQMNRAMVDADVFQEGAPIEV